MPAYSGAFFFLADQRGMACFPKSVRFAHPPPPNVIEILKLLREGKKQNVQIHTNSGYKIVERWGDSKSGLRI